MSVVIFGQSDNLVEIEGDVEGEFPAFEDEEGYIALSNGVVLSAVFDDTGIWRVRPAYGGELVVIEYAPDGDENNYSDRATVRGDIKWAVYGSCVGYS